MEPERTKDSPPSFKNSLARWSVRYRQRKNAPYHIVTFQKAWSFLSLGLRTGGGVRKYCFACIEGSSLELRVTQKIPTTPELHLLLVPTVFLFLEAKAWKTRKKSSRVLRNLPSSSAWQGRAQSVKVGKKVLLRKGNVLTLWGWVEHSWMLCIKVCQARQIPNPSPIIYGLFV